MVNPRNFLQPDEIAVAALGYLADDPERLERFMALTGVTPANLRAMAAQKGFLAAVLDHVLQDETLLLAFAGHAGIRPESIGQARHRLAPEEAWEP